jgi:hypothetical protein
MATNPYIKASDFVKVNETNMISSDPNVIGTIIKSATSPTDLIDAIEAYNTTHKLNIRNRIRYGIGIGEAFITVISATKSGSCYKIITQDGNGRPKSVADANGKITSMAAAYHTHFVAASAITDVIVSGYDSEILDPIIANTGVDNIDSSAILNEMRTLVQEFNAMLSAGEIRDYIKKFNYIFKTRKYNDITYEHNVQLYNMYNQLTSQYLLTIKNIVNNAIDLGKVTSPVNLRDKPLYFIEGNDLKSAIDSRIKELWPNETKTEYDNKYDSRYQELIQKTFTTEEVGFFKDVIK